MAKNKNTIIVLAIIAVIAFLAFKGNVLSTPAAGDATCILATDDKIKDCYLKVSYDFNRAIDNEPYASEIVDAMFAKCGKMTFMPDEEHPTLKHCMIDDLTGGDTVDDCIVVYFNIERSLCRHPTGI